MSPAIAPISSYSVSRPADRNRGRAAEVDRAPQGHPLPARRVAARRQKRRRPLHLRRRARTRADREGGQDGANVQVRRRWAHVDVVKKPGLSHSLLGGWEWSGIESFATGVPLTVVNGTTYGDNSGVGNGVGTAGISFPDVIGSSTSGIPPASQVSSPSYAKFGINPGAFVLPQGLTFGDAGRNDIRNPSRLNFDMGVSSTSRSPKARRLSSGRKCSTSSTILNSRSRRSKARLEVSPLP